jgi:ABC-type transport system involved in multi-copper enzyme maturation permease subunit
MPLVLALVIKEFQTWLRGRLTFLLFTALVLLMSVLFLMLSLRVLGVDPNAPPGITQNPNTTNLNAFVVGNRGVLLFGSMGLCLLLAAGVIAPAVAASAFASEREHGMFDLLLLQTPGAGRIVFGKAVAAFLFTALVLGMAAPLYGPAWSFGGVEPQQIGIFVAIAAACTLFFTCLGLFFGAVVRGGLSATILAQAVALFVLFGLPGVGLLAEIAGAGEAFRPLLWFNPFLSLMSAGGSVTEAFAREVPRLYRGMVSLPTITPIPGTTLPVWGISGILWVLASVVLLIATAVAIDPCHPLKTMRKSGS